MSGTLSEVKSSCRCEMSRPGALLSLVDRHRILVELSKCPMAKRVLIVDDDPAQRRILEETIKRLGFETKTVASGEQALQILEGPERASISLVLLDLVMPGLDGMGVLDAARTASPAFRPSSCRPRTARSTPPSTPCAPAPSTSSSSRRRPSGSKSRSRAR